MPAIRFCSTVLIVVVCLLSASESAHGNLPWPAAKKESMRLRLVALAWNHSRTSFFASEEIFVPEKESTKDGAGLVKLVYEFVRSQPRLSEKGLNYSTLHELRGV